MPLTGITNANEFYSNHYLDAILQDDIKGVAQRLIEKGVPAVVAMQYPVLIDSATLFAEKFYAL